MVIAKLSDHAMVALRSGGLNPLALWHKRMFFRCALSELWIVYETPLIPEIPTAVSSPRQNPRLNAQILSYIGCAELFAEFTVTICRITATPA